MTGTDGELTLPVQAGFATTMAIFFVVDIFGNSLVIWAILTNTKLQSTSNFYLFALAVTDITIGNCVVCSDCLMILGFDITVDLVFTMASTNSFNPHFQSLQSRLRVKISLPN